LEGGLAEGAVKHRGDVHDGDKQFFGSGRFELKRLSAECELTGL